MNYFNKYRVVFWIMILMIVINISAFTSFFYFYKANKTTATDTVSCGSTCRILNEQLGLTAEQSAKVSLINKNFREETEPVVAEIKNTRTALLAELTMENPDTSRLSQFTDKIGQLQKALQKSAVIQFQQLKKICTPDQCLKLSAIYSDVYGCRKMNADSCKGMQKKSIQGRTEMECGKNP